MPCETINSTKNSAFARSHKRRKGYPSETKVKRGHRVVHCEKELVEKLRRNDPCPAAPAAGFKRCCLRTGKYDGGNRNYFFPRVEKRCFSGRNEEGAGAEKLLSFAFYSPVVRGGEDGRRISTDTSSTALQFLVSHPSHFNFAHISRRFFLGFLHK